MRRKLGSLVVVFTLAVLTGHARPAAGFDFDTGNAPIEVIIPVVAPIIFTDISPSGSDATLVLRVTALVTNAWFDATAPYHPTAQGVYSRLGRRPAAESATNRNINIACLYSTLRVLNSLLPKRNAEWRAMLANVGLNPDDTTEDTATPAGLGNLAGKAIVAFREHDGMNQLGDVGGIQYNRQAYADYTGYAPVNTAYDFRDPSRWQPRVVSSGNGLFRVQQFVTPQYRLTKPYSYLTPSSFNTPKPDASDPHGSKGRKAYQDQVDAILSASANLTDHQKMMAELFNNKIAGLGFSAVFAALSRGLSLMDFIHLDFVTNLAAFDVGIAVWNEKAKWDAPRPWSAVRYVYGNRLVRAWGGPGKGTVDLPAVQWKEYLNVADHPEYPSGSVAFCEAHAQSARRFLGTDALNWSVPAPQGSSSVEPGITPATDIVLGPWATWTAFAADCGQSRLWGGVHFPAAIAAGRPLGTAIGELAYVFLKRHIDGNAPPLP
jgi:hypothetical protein